MNTIEFKEFFKRVQANTTIRTQTELAEALGIGRAAISVAKQKDVIPAKWILSLSSTFNLPPTLFTDAEPATETSIDDLVIQLPRLSLQTAAMIHKTPEGRNAQNVDDSFRISKDWLTDLGNLEAMAFFDLHTDNMEPEIHQDARLLVDTSQTSPCSGGIYVFKIQGELTVRRVDKSLKHLILLSSNPRFKEIAIHLQELESLFVLGRVVMACSPFPLNSQDVPVEGAPQALDDEEKEQPIIRQHSLLSP